MRDRNAFARAAIHQHQITLEAVLLLGSRQSVFPRNMNGSSSRYGEN
jgi:hypothetical protein